MRAFNRSVVGPAANNTLEVASKFYNQALVPKPCPDFNKLLRTARRSEADFAPAVNRHVDLTSVP